MRNARSWTKGASVLGLGVAAAMIALLLRSEPEAPVVRTSSFRAAAVVASAKVDAVEQPSPERKVVKVSCPSTLPLPVDRDGAALRAAIAALDRADTSVTQLQDLGRLLERLLARRPELGRAAVQALESTHDRRVLLQLWHAVRVVVDAPRVHSELLAVVRGQGPDEAREAAVLALAGRGDASALAAFGQVLADDGAGVLARSAAAYGLSRDAEKLSSPERTLAQSRARALVASRATPDRLRIESFDLLGSVGLDASDRASARSALAHPTEDVALAAARALLFSGEDRASVARALRARGTQDPVFLAQLDLLEGKMP